MRDVEEELLFVSDILERMPTVEFLSLLSRFCGGGRATQLIGWAVLLGAAGLENGPKLRHALDQAGYSESAMYRAVADLRKFGEFLEQEYHQKMSVQELVRRIIPAA